jgi:hypothetical protein
MGNCLVTKLKGTVQNSDLLRVGELRICVHKIDNPSSETQRINLNFTEDVKLEIIGDGYFTNATLVSNLGKSLTAKANTESLVYVSNGDFEIAILNKYALTKINTRTNKKTAIKDIADLKYSSSINYIAVNSVENVSYFSDLKSLKTLTYLSISNANINGNLSDLEPLTNLLYLIIGNTSNKITGNVSSLKAITKLNTLVILNSDVTGDLATLPSTCRSAAFDYHDTNAVFDWSSRPASSKIIAIRGNPKLNNIDKMLQDQANCVVGFTSADDASYKKIEVSGTRTSASDAALATLQQKGYTVTITPA